MPFDAAHWVKYGNGDVKALATPQLEAVVAQLDAIEVRDVGLEEATRRKAQMKASLKAMRDEELGEIAREVLI